MLVASSSVLCINCCALHDLVRVRLCAFLQCSGSIATEPVYTIAVFFSNRIEISLFRVDDVCVCVCVSLHAAKEFAIITDTERPTDE